MPSETSTFKFLQLSDVHLDSSQNRGVLTFSQSQREARYTDLMESLVGAIKVASDQNVDAVLIPGGLWDHRSIRSQTAGTVLEAFEELGHIPVFITPGEGDPYTIDSFYHPRFLSAKGMRSWPANTHIFTTAHFQTIKHPTRPDVAITGFAYNSQKQLTERMLENYIARDSEATFNILMLHGSLDTYPGLDGLSQERITAPFSVEELAAQQFNYAALGHFHEYTELCDENDRVIGSYSGCLCGRNFEELGPRIAILGSITCDSSGQYTVELEPIEVASNRLTYLTVDVSGLDAESLKEEIAYGVQEQEIRPDVDIVCISLEGSHAPDLDPFEVASQLNPDFYHLLIVDRTRPDYLSEEFQADTPEQKFLAHMIEKQRKAEEQRARDPRANTLSSIPALELSGKTIEDALYYGLDALKRRKVTLRHVD